MLQVEVYPANVKLKQARLEKGFSQEKLARLVCVKQQSISAYENNTRMPSMQIALKLAEVLDKNLSELFFS